MLTSTSCQINWGSTLKFKFQLLCCIILKIKVCLWCCSQWSRSSVSYHIKDKPEYFLYPAIGPTKLPALQEIVPVTFARKNANYHLSIGTLFCSLFIKVPRQEQRSDLFGFRVKLPLINYTVPVQSLKDGGNPVKCLHSRRRAKQFGRGGRICPNVQNKIFPNVLCVLKK